MISRIDEVMEKIQSVAIAGHIRPDGDCVGSCLGVYNYLHESYPQVEVQVFLDPIPHIFEFLKGADAIKEAKEGADFCPDLFICLDCGDAGRLGDAAAIFEKAKHTLCIDHHLSNTAFADENYIFPKASSTCELVFELLDKTKITADMAACLYTGMVHDTGVFQYTCTSSKTMQAAGFLMDTGIDYTGIIDRTFYAKTFDQNRILGLALMKATLHYEKTCGTCIASIITRQEMEKYHVLPKHLEGIVNQLRVTKDTEAAIFLYESIDGTYKVSTRANGDVNLAAIAQRYGGGGHAKAAGFSVAKDPNQAVEEIAKAIYEEACALKGNVSEKRNS